VAIPKAAGRSLVSWLVRYWDGEVVGNAYGFDVPEECLGYTIFTAVRDPWERLHSLWWHSCCDPTRPTKCRLFGLSLLRYLTFLLDVRDKGDPLHATPMAYMNQAQYYRACGASAHIRLDREGFELISDGDCSLVFESKQMPRHSNQSQTRPEVPMGKVFSKHERALAREYMQDSAEFFGFDEPLYREKPW